MKDFILLIKNPRAIFCKEREDVSIIITLLLCVALSSLSLWLTIMGGSDSFLTETLNRFHVNPLVMIPVIVVIAYIALVISVAIPNLFLGLFIKNLDHVEYNKKYLKKLVYLATMLPSILTYALDCIFTILTNYKAEPSYLIQCTGIYSTLITAILLSTVLDKIIKAKKSAVVFPILYFIVLSGSNIVNLFT